MALVNVLFLKPNWHVEPAQRLGVRMPAQPLHTQSLAANQDFTVVGATGSPTNILSVKIFDGSGNLVSTVQPFNFLTSLRVATGDFNGDGLVNEFAVLGRRTGIERIAPLRDFTPISARTNAARRITCRLSPGEVR